MLYQLMYKDEVRAEFGMEQDMLGPCVGEVKVLGNLPYGMNDSNVLDWLEKRHPGRMRGHLNTYLYSIGHNNLVGLIELAHCVSLNDCYWVREYSENLTWNDVSPYRNDFVENIADNAFNGSGMCGVRHDGVTAELSTAGNFDKCWKREVDGVYMYKRGSDKSHNAGLEPYSEVLASQVYDALGCGIKYDLVKLHKQVASKCKLFCTEDRSFIPYTKFIPAFGDGLANMLFFYDCISHEAGERFRTIMVADALTFNSDRHAGNHGVICEGETSETLECALSFDYNQALLPYMTEWDFKNVGAKLRELFIRPSNCGSFEMLAKKCMTESIRSKLLEMRGMELKIKCDRKFTDKRLSTINDLFHVQLEGILHGAEIISYNGFAV